MKKNTYDIYIRKEQYIVTYHSSFSKLQVKLINGLQDFFKLLLRPESQCEATDNVIIMKPVLLTGL